MSNILKTRKLNEAQSDLKYYSGCAGKIIRWDEVSSSDVGLSGLINSDNGYVIDASVQARLTIYDPNKDIIQGDLSSFHPIANTIPEIFDVIDKCAINQKFLIDNATGTKITVSTIPSFSAYKIYVFDNYENKPAGTNKPILKTITICYYPDNGEDNRVKVSRSGSEFRMMPNWTSYYNVEWRKIRTIVSGDRETDTIKDKLGSLSDISIMKQLAESGMPIVSKTSEPEPTQPDQTEINDNFGMIYVTYYGKKSDNTFLLRYVAFERPTENKVFYAPHIETIIVWYNAGSTSTVKWWLTEGLKTFINGMLYLGVFPTTTAADAAIEQAALYVDTCPIIYCTINGSQPNEPRGMYVRQRKFKSNINDDTHNNTDKVRVVEQVMYRNEYRAFNIGNTQDFAKDIATSDDKGTPNIWTSGYHFRHVYIDCVEKKIFHPNENPNLGWAHLNDGRGWRGLFNINESTKHRLHEVICGWQRFNTDNSRQFRPISTQIFSNFTDLSTFLNTLPYDNYYNIATSFNGTTDSTSINGWNNTNGNVGKGWDLQDWGDTEYDKTTEDGFYTGNQVKRQNACRNLSGYGKFIVNVGDNQTIYYLTLTKISDTKTLMYMEGASFQLNSNEISVNDTGAPNMVYRYGIKNTDSSTTWDSWYIK